MARTVFILLVMNKTPFAAILTANTALSYSSLAVTGVAARYLGHAHALHQWQGP